MKHIHQGGTAITNFGLEQTGIYAQAILYYKHGDLLIGAPMPSMSGQDLSRSCLALHSTTAGRFPENIHEFWEIFKALREAHGK